MGVLDRGSSMKRLIAVSALVGLMFVGFPPPRLMLNISLPKRLLPTLSAEQFCWMTFKKLRSKRLSKRTQRQRVKSEQGYVLWRPLTGGTSLLENELERPAITSRN